MMRHCLLLLTVLLFPTFAHAQSPAPDLKMLFDTAQAVGIETELRGDIAAALGFGEDALAIKDLVITQDGVQHAVNAFVVGDKSFLLFNSHLQKPTIYLYVKEAGGAFVSAVRGTQFRPITEATKIMVSDVATIALAEELFWLQWLSDGAKLPAQ